MNFFKTGWAWCNDPHRGVGFDLCILVLVAALPLAIFGGGVAWMVVDQKKAAVEGELASTTRALRVAVDRELASQFAAMDVLAADVSLDSSNLPAFLAMTRRVLKVHGEWYNVTLIDPQTHAIVASGVPYLAAEPMTSSPAEVDLVAKTRRPVTVGMQATGNIIKKPFIKFLAPVMRAGQVRFVLAVVINPEKMSTLFIEQRLAPSWTGAILDNRMLLAGRSRDAGRYVGQRATAKLVRTIAASDSGMFTAQNQEGDLVYTVFNRSPTTGWSVVIGIPAAEIEGPIKHLLLQLLLAASVLIAFALVFAAPVGRGIVRRRAAYITERAYAEQQLRIAATAFESQEGMFITDARKVILRVNRAFTSITGYSAEETVGNTPHLLGSGRHDAAFFAAMTESLKVSGTWQGEIWNRRKNGELYPEWLTISAVRNGAGEIDNYVAALSDITARKAADEEIKNLAFYDPLTGLPNRRLLLSRLEHALAASVRHQRKGALLFIDLDNFKTINDTRGHDKGDLLLQQVAQRLNDCAREGDTVSRFGGDEFVVMLEDLSENLEEAANQAETVGKKILETLEHTYQFSSYEHHTSASIGITLFANHQESTKDLLKRADLAMYQAKAAGRNTLRFFDPIMQAVVSAHAALEAGLRDAVRKQQFVLYFQPQVNGEHRLGGVEALVRWIDPQRGMVSPAEFIPVAEDTGLILPLGLWVLQTACAQLASWATRPVLADLTVAVNISVHQIEQRDFVAQVLAALERSGANPQRLKLELTESVLVSNVEDTITKMNALKHAGVGFSLDDFGTGYSSLSYLKRLPLDQLKIDQGFVRDILVDPNDAAIAKMVIALGASLGLAVIAEGVETEQQRAFLARLGCHAYQGYLASAPLPLSAFEDYVQRHWSPSASAVPH